MNIFLVCLFFTDYHTEILEPTVHHLGFTIPFCVKSKSALMLNNDLMSEKLSHASLYSHASGFVRLHSGALNAKFSMLTTFMIATSSQ